MSTKINHFVPFGQETRLAVQSQVADDDKHNAPGLFWLGGFKSSMDGTKATALAAWAETEGLAATRFDYSGHGASEGAFEDGTISAWLAQSIAVFEQYSSGPQVIIGSSMGGWLAMLLHRHLQAKGQADRVHALVLIAPAADMSEELMWQKFPPDIQRTIKEDGVWQRPSAYGDGDYAITKSLIEDGRSHLILGEVTDVSCPVRILHGELDPDVPWQHGKRLYDQLAGDDVTFTLIKGGDHRLSSEREIERLLKTLSALV
ncbi:MAG: alpha/beta hydrolase [Pseudomonadota bacterium]